MMRPIFISSIGRGIEVDMLELIKKGYKLDIVDFVFWSCTFLLVLTELLSAGHWINRVSIVVGWSLWLCFHVFFYIKNKKEISDIIKNWWKELNGYKILFALLVMFSMIILYVSYETVPANWDSNAYHLPRVMHWIQNRSIDYYATAGSRQCYSPPYSEYIIMHIALIRGTTIHSGVMNGLCYIISACLVYKISKKLGVDYRDALLAATIFMLSPPALAESMTTQSDLCSAMTLLIAFYYLLDFVLPQKLELNNEIIWTAIKFGITVVLCYEAKTNTLVNVLILVLFMAVWRIVRKDKWGTLFSLAGIGICAALVFVSPMIIRNIITYGAISAEGQTDIIVSTTNPKLIFMCCYENVSEYIATPMIPGYAHTLIAVGYRLAGLLKVDCNDWTISSGYEMYEGEWMYHHDVCCNFVMAVVCVIALIILMHNVKKRQLQLCGWLLWMAIASWLALSAMAGYTKYKPRLMLPISAIIILLGVVIIAKAELKEKNRGICEGIIITVALLSAIGALHFNIMHNIEDSDYGVKLGGYFVDNPVEWEYTTLTDQVNSLGVSEIGLLMTDFARDYEYPLWMKLKGYNRIEHVNVDNELAKLEDSNFIPECIIDVTESGAVVGDTLVCHGREYVCTWQLKDTDDYRIYMLAENNMIMSAE